jgi:PKD repeat protein
MFRTLLAFAALLGAVAVVVPATASAAPPSNDAFADASAITSLPFSDAVDITEATVESGEPQNCSYTPQTVWYAITPTMSGLLRVDPSGSFYGAELNVYRQDGVGLGGLSFLGCGSYSTSVSVSVLAGQTYYIQGGNIFGNGGTLHVSVQLVPPPANDDFGNAMPIGSVPFSSSIDASGATLEPAEPTPSCGYGQSTGTVWYAFTPSVSGSYSASSQWSGFYTQVAAYTGGSLGSLSQLGCRTFGQLLTFHADAGTTYYFQVGGLFGGRGTVSFAIDTAPNPVAGFSYYPSDPSSVDTIQFVDQSSDPGQVGFSAWRWDFGDGSSSSAQSPTHRYLADGDYKAGLTVTSSDGRTASTSQVVHVRTHDVSIAKLVVPQSSGVGQTRSISVGISNTRYPETVQVQLLKSSATGWTVVGTLTQSVPVRSSNRTTDFAFSYTFTSDDAALGKVSFRAVASIVNARDALPGDNDVTALPTNVH